MYMHMQVLCYLTVLKASFCCNPSPLVTTFYSDANVYAEDCNRCTPVLIAAAGKNNQAFQCLMKFMDLQDKKKNPVFKALNVTLNRIEILHVS